MAVGIRRADNATPLYPQKLAVTSPTSGGRSVGIVRWQTKGTGFVSIMHRENGIVPYLVKKEAIKFAVSFRPTSSTAYDKLTCQIAHVQPKTIHESPRSE
jgi:hypothetical protein